VRLPPPVRCVAWHSSAHCNRQSFFLIHSACFLTVATFPLKTEGASFARIPPLLPKNPSVLTAHSQPPCARLGRRKATVERETIGGEAIREERRGESFAGTEQLTVQGLHLHPGEAAPDFSLADLAGMVRLLNVVNSLERPLCQLVTRRWEALCSALLPDVCIYTVSMDPPQMQACW
jgi:hypothetical protein